VIDLQVADERARVLADLLKVATGERDEARRLMADMDQRRVENAVSMARLSDHLIAAADELKLTAKERDGYMRALTASDDLLGKVQRERDTAETQRDAAELRALNLQRELDALRKSVESSVPTMLDEVGAVETPCAWCLRGVGVGKEWWLRATEQRDDPRLPVCASCVANSYISGTAVRARVAARAASCPTRRTSPDPLAVECALGCGAPAGVPCVEAQAPDGTIDS
jgi:hypothetical protein